MLGRCFVNLWKLCESSTRRNNAASYAAESSFFCGISPGARTPRVKCPASSVLRTFFGDSRTVAVGGVQGTDVASGTSGPAIRPATDNRTYRRASMYQVSRALRRASGALIVSVGLALAPPVAVPSQAAASAGCEGGGFVINGLTNRGTIGIDGRLTIPPDNPGPHVWVVG